MEACSPFRPLLLAVLMAAAAGPAAGINLVANPDFGDYTNVPATGSIALADALPAGSWAETGASGGTQVGSSFGAFVASTGHVAWLRQQGEGFYQTIATVPGVSYIVDAVYGQFADVFRPRVRISAFDGAGIGPAALLDTRTYELDADLYGDYDVTSSYVVLFSSASSLTTLSFTLEELSGPNDPGAAIDYVEVRAIPEPSPRLLLAGGLGLLGTLSRAASRRTRRRQTSTRLDDA